MNNQDEDLVSVEDLTLAFETLPILSRLEFVKNIIINHGGDIASEDQNPALILASELVSGVIDILQTHPRAARLGGPLPRPHGPKL